MNGRINLLEEDVSIGVGVLVIDVRSKEVHEATLIFEIGRPRSENLESLSEL